MCKIGSCESVQDGNDPMRWNVVVEVKVCWWVSFTMHAACWIAWCLRGRVRKYWLGFVMCSLVPWMMKHGVRTQVVN